jgi:hypothetical protein
MDLLKQKLGKRLTPQGESAWKKTVDVAYKFIFEGLQTHENSNVIRVLQNVTPRNDRDS